jgi:hypothetical protein
MFFFRAPQLDRFERSALHYAAGAASASCCKLLCEQCTPTRHLLRTRVLMLAVVTVSKPQKLRPDCNKRNPLHFAACSDTLGEAVAVLLKEVGDRVIYSSRTTRGIYSTVTYVPRAFQ